MLPVLTIHLFGRFEVARSGALIPDADWRGQKTRDLLKILILARGRFTARDQLGDWLWPAAESGPARTNLRAVVSDLRRILEPNLGRGRDSSFVLTRHEGYAFQLTAGSTVDAFVFERLATSPEPGDLAAALALYRGDLLEEDPYAEWALAERDHLRNMHLTLLASWAESLFRAAAYSECRHICEQALARDPGREALWRTLIQAHAASGDRAAALATFDRCRAALSRDLGVDPSSETIALHTEILRTDSTPGAIVGTAPKGNALTGPRTANVWLNRLGAAGFILWAGGTGSALALSLAGLFQGSLVSPGDPGAFALPYFLQHPAALADLNWHVYLYFPAGWLLLPGYVAWFQVVRGSRRGLAWLGLCLGLVDALSQTIGQSIGLAQMTIFPTAYVSAGPTQQLTLVTVWDVLRQLSALTGTVGLVANPLALFLLLLASRRLPGFSTPLVWSGLTLVGLSAGYYALPDGPATLFIGLALAFGLRLWLAALAFVIGSARNRSATIDPP